MITETTALIPVDLQNDFMPGGALAVPAGDEVVAVANELMRQYKHVVPTQDWHPANHGSFVGQHEGADAFQVVQLYGLAQVAWPEHCVQGSQGAAFHSDLEYDTSKGRVFQKGMDPKVDSYSGFFDNAKRGDTGLAAYLRELGVDTLHIIGLATDFCVKFTVLDALGLGFKVVLLTEGCRGLTEEGSAAAIEEMRAAGAEIE